MRVNLHTHSNVSDGSLTPKELVKKLYHDGVKVFALTDHDKIDGIKDAKEVSEKLGVKMINGIEISCYLGDINLDFINHESGIHLLGLNFELERIKEIYQERKRIKYIRIKDLINTLKRHGYNISDNIETNKKITIANELVDRGYAKNIQEAFNEIINIYYDKYIDNMNVKEAIKIIHDSGGKAIWAHPYDILDFVVKERIDEKKIEELCKEFKSLGLDGLEVYYELYSKNQINFLEQMIEKYGFIASAGTDYHGKVSQPATFIDIDEKQISEVIK